MPAIDYLAQMHERDAAEKAANEQGLPGSLVNPLPPVADAPVRTRAQIRTGATVWDSWYMPVAVTSDGFAWYPTPCCGASAKGLEGYVGCRSCYAEVEGEGGVPEMPFTAYPDFNRA